MCRSKRFRYISGNGKSLAFTAVTENDCCKSVLFLAISTSYTTYAKSHTTNWISAGQHFSFSQLLQDGKQEVGSQKLVLLLLLWVAQHGSTPVVDPVFMADEQLVGALWSGGERGESRGAVKGLYGLYKYILPQQR
jgi:hypothetical protein